VNKWVWIILAVFGFVGLFCVGTSIWGFFQRRKILARTRPLKGQVVEIELHRTPGQTSLYPLVEVVDPSGRKIRFSSKAGGYEHQVKVQVGDRVDVLYDPLKDRYELEEFERSFDFILTFFAIGMVFIVFSSLAFLTVYYL
jgi:hypothetical protein